MQDRSFPGSSAFLLICSMLITGCNIQDSKVLGEESPLEISGIYPHLAFYNHEDECGTGALVPWAGDLWAVTYGPHLPHGSSDKLYQITPSLELIPREESTGGTPANRMIHRESGQLFIGPYAIDTLKNVRTIPYEAMTGRHTGNARHLQDPENKIYYATMEEGFYEVDVHKLEVHTLVPDAHDLPEEEFGTFLPGAHGKGLYSGQGVLVYANNGEYSREAMERFDVESGALAEWDGRKWTLIRRNQFTEVTGPGGICGNARAESDPIWTTGWDHRSLLLGVREAEKGWSFYRLPKASHSYDGAHGWNTEWPRIRDVGTAGKTDYLMTMHGMFWHFPETFSSQSSRGIRPRSAYLKVVGDFTRWGDRLVLGCDDAAHREFLNKRRVKGGIEGPGQSNSNLWFLDPSGPDKLGPTTAGGAVWLNERVEAGQVSDPFLFEGWDQRACWLGHDSREAVVFGIEMDEEGRGNWEELNEISVPPGQGKLLHFTESEKGAWVRISCRQSCTATAHFVYNDLDLRPVTPDPMFRGLAPVFSKEARGGLLYGLGDDRGKLGILAQSFRDGRSKDEGYYELNERMEIHKVDDPETASFIRGKFAIPREVLSTEASSVLVVDDRQRRWRLPRGLPDYDRLTQEGVLRISREVATERDLFSCQGTFYELPAENADGFAKIRPICSHPFRIHDYASYRGLLVLTGIDPGLTKGNPHVFTSDDGKASVWAGVIDDLWKLGKPVGVGGPWLNTAVEAGEVSDPYLIGFYDSKILELSHSSLLPVVFHMEVDVSGNGPWVPYMSVIVPPGDGYLHLFPDYFQARWIRFRSDSATTATTWLTYE